MKRISTLLLVALLAFAGCGDDEDDTANGPAAVTTTQETTTQETTPEKKEKAGTAITLADSEFGQMLFDSNKQAIYIFENDPKGDSVCYDECAEAWPPVLTKGDPQAGDGVKANLLGTIEREDGTTQVTYADQPLYFYAHESPGEVRCHNVNLNGGYWWVVGPDGNRRP